MVEEKNGIKYIEIQNDYSYHCLNCKKTISIIRKDFSYLDKCVLCDKKCIKQDSIFILRQIKQEKKCFIIDNYWDTLDKVN